MKTYKLLVALCAALVCFTPGCGVLYPKGKVEWKAAQFLSFRDCWDVTHAAYGTFKNRQAAGKVSAADVRDIDKAWNAYRSAYLIAIEAAQMDQNAFTPENVRKLADDVLTLIAAL